MCRLLLGFGKGATVILIPIYVGEVAHKLNRGRYAFFLPMELAMGFVYSFATGSYFSTRVYTLLCTAPILLALILILTVVPETPYFLMAKNRPRYEVAEVLAKLRSCSDLEEEMKQIEGVESSYEFVAVLSPAPFVCIVLFTLAYSFGLGPVPYAYMSEFFPQHVKNLGVSVCTAIGFLVSGLIALVFPYFMDYLGMQWCFWLFGTICMICTIFTKYVVPDTDGKTLDEIQRLMEE
nr:unnamed protein product [Callosobruchus analis]